MMNKLICDICGTPIDIENESLIVDVLDDNGEVIDCTVICPKCLDGELGE